MLRDHERLARRSASIRPELRRLWLRFAAALFRRPRSAGLGLLLYGASFVDLLRVVRLGVPWPTGQEWWTVDALEWQQKPALTRAARAARPPSLRHSCGNTARTHEPCPDRQAAAGGAARDDERPDPGCRSHPSESDELADLTPGTTIGPYVILDRLGRGGMGQVFLANDSRLRRKVALKCLLSRRNAHYDVRSQVLREARAAARISHPNVAAVHDVIEHGARVFIVMEYVEGESLSARLKRERLPIGTVIAIGRQLASALGAAHARGIVHRDLKPANIQVALDGSVKVVDFGVAAAVATPATVTAVTAGYTDTAVRGWHAGTPGYMSPEQLFGRDTGPRSDIFSLGIVLFELATGQRLFADSDPHHVISALAKPLPRAVAIAPSVPPQLSDVIARALETDPDRRIQSAADFESALAELDQVRDAPTIPIGRPDPPSTAVAAGGEGVHDLRGRLILAHSQPELLRLRDEVEQYLATRPHDVDGRVLKDDVDRAIGAGPSSARGRRLDFCVGGDGESRHLCRPGDQSLPLGAHDIGSAGGTNRRRGAEELLIGPRSAECRGASRASAKFGSSDITTADVTGPESAARGPRPPVSAPLAPPPSSVSGGNAAGAGPAPVAPPPATEVETPGIPRRPGEAWADYTTRAQSNQGESRRGQELPRKRGLCARGRAVSSGRSSPEGLSRRRSPHYRCGDQAARRIRSSHEIRPGQRAAIAAKIVRCPEMVFECTGNRSQCDGSSREDRSTHGASDQRGIGGFQQRRSIQKARRQRESR